jgi:peptide chain release factor subunit 1
MPRLSAGTLHSMALQEQTTDRLRALTEVEIPAGRVISLYFDLDPARFATPPARQSEVRSLVDELDRRIDELAGDLDHDEVVGLRADRDRVEDLLTGGLETEGTRGVAIFACEPSGLWQVVLLPHPVDFEVTIDAGPHVEQLAREPDAGSWAVVMLSRAHGRVLRGDARRLVETIERDDDVHGQHRKGGWSHPRYERSVDREADAHVSAVLDALYRSYRRRPFDHLLFVTHSELWPSIERSLHGDLAPLVAGRVESEVEYASPQDVLEVARPEMQRIEVERERELLGRLAHGLGTGGRGVAGLQPTLDALLQGRVEALLVLDGFSAAGAVCPECGWMGADPDTAACPVDGHEVQRRASIADAAVASALGQDAQVLYVRRGDGDAPSPRYLELQGHGGIAAVLRF